MASELTQYTPNYNLIKPDQTDFYDVDDFNNNTDVIDSELKKANDKIESMKVPNGTLSQKGIVQLNNQTNSTSDAEAATPSAVKQAYDKAVAAQISADGKQNSLNRSVSNNDNATGSITDTGNALTIPVPVTTAAPAASSTQVTAGTWSLRAVIQNVINNIAQLFSGKQNNLNRTVQTNLASATAATDTGGNITPGITGTLGISNGGTGNTTGNAATVGGLSVSSGVNNAGNQIVRTNGSGYAMFGYINTNTAVENPAIGNIFVENTGADGYLRKASLAHLWASLLAAGTTAQYWRGDKTWQALNAAAVGLGNVTNTAQAPSTHLTDTAAHSTQFAAKEPSIAAGTTAQYWRGDKTWQALNAAAVGLGNVPNYNAQPVIGSYVGNGATNQTIILGFNPSLVIVVSTNFGFFSSTLDALSGGIASSGNGASSVYMTTNGFIVIYAPNTTPKIATNIGSQYYIYVAWR